MSKKQYERPFIQQLNVGTMNKFGTRTEFAPTTQIDGVPVKRIISEHGSPCFVLSERTIRKTYQDTVRAFKTRYPKVQFAWSYKTNYLNAVCNIFHQEGSWAEVVSIFEYEKAIKNGVPGTKIIFNGPEKSKSDLKTAVENNSMIHIDHLDELYELVDVVKTINKKARVAIRVNMDTGVYPIWDRFGFNYENGQAWSAINKIMSHDELDLVGLHCHIGTYMLSLTDTDTLRDQWSTATAARKVVALAGADAHAKVSLVDAEPGNNRYSVPIPSYESSFASLSVHVRLDQPFSGEAPADAERLIQGLRSGAVFVAVDGWASPAAFEYWATEGALRAEQGGSLAAKAPVSLHVRNNAPDGYRTIVWKDHKRLEERTEREFELPVGSAPAVYSIEVRRDGRGGPPWVISNPVYVGERDAHGVGTDGTQPTANRTARLLFDGRSTRGWSQEGDSSSAAALGIAKLVAGDAIHLRYGLAGGAAVGQFVAAAVDTPEGVDDASGVRFRVHASADMRFALQVRADGPEAAPERWERSVFITPNDSEHFVRFADMTPVGAMHSTRAPLSKVRSVLFVVDTTNTKPGATGQIWLSEVRLVRE